MRETQRRGILFAWFYNPSFRKQNQSERNGTFFCLAAKFEFQEEDPFVGRVWISYWNLYGFSGGGGRSGFLISKIRKRKIKIWVLFLQGSNNGKEKTQEALPSLERKQCEFLSFLSFFLFFFIPCNLDLLFLFFSQMLLFDR